MIDFIAFPLFVFYCQVIITKCYKCFMEVIMKPKIAVLSTYPPTQCGIATFSQSLVNGLLSQNASVDVVRLIDEPQPRPSKAVYQ